jgi:uncharacterized protein (DUF58 family)
MITELEWTVAPAARRAVLVAGVAVAAAFWFDRPGLIGIAAVPLGLLLLARSRPRPVSVEITIHQPERSFEGERVPVTVLVRTDRPVGIVEATLVAAPGMAGQRATATSRAANTTRLEWTTTITGSRWGSRPVGYVQVHLWDQQRLLASYAWAWPENELLVYPRPAPLRRLVLSSTRFDRAGDHPAAAEGEGIEFGSVRQFVATDRPRRVNWPVSTRRGGLYVTTRRAERAVDVVLAVDVLADAGPPGRSSRDLALAGCAGVARAVLRQHDRVGLVALGGRLQWLKPDLAERQFYRIVDALLAVTDWFSYLDPDVDTIPYTALPAGARLVFFSPLIDPRGIAAARRLRARGHPVTVVDVCTTAPEPHDAMERLALRLWRLERIANRRRLAAEGIRIVPWDGTQPLDATLAEPSRFAERHA